MRIPTTRGTCERCGTSGTRGVLRKHLAVCSAPMPEDSRRGRRRPAVVPGLLIEVVGRPKAYWLFLGVAHDAKLSDLDAWLRAIWLECCDHLSEFVIGPTRYSSDPSPTFSLRARSQSTHIGVGKVLRPGVAFQHHYDFGSTTVVDISVVSGADRPSRLPRRSCCWRTTKRQTSPAPSAPNRLSRCVRVRRKRRSVLPLRELLVAAPMWRRSAASSCELTASGSVRLQRTGRVVSRAFALKTCSYLDPRWAHWSSPRKCGCGKWRSRSCRGSSCAGTS